MPISPHITSRSNMLTAYLNKLIRGGIAIVLVLGCFAAGTAQAQIPVTDVAHLFETTLGVGQNTITAAQTTIGTVQQLYEWTQTFVLADLKKQLLDSISKKTLSFIQGGGQPKFVTNWSTYFNQASLSGAASVAAGVQNAQLCDTFSQKLKSDIGNPGPNTTDVANMSSLNCDFKPGELNAFNNDFRNGGWDAYLKTLEPNNNYTGAYLATKNAQAQSAAQAQEAAKSEAIAGGGFLSAKTVDSAGNTTITAPGSVFEHEIANTLNGDRELIVNATQLSDLIGSIANGVSSEVLKSNGSGDTGLTGINLAARQRASNARRNPDGTIRSITAEDCAEVLTIVDVDNNGAITQIDIDVAIENAQNDPTNNDYALYSACLGSVNAEEGAQNRKERLLSQLDDIANTLRAAKSAMSNLSNKIKALAAFTIATASGPGLNPDRSCFNLAADGINDDVNNPKQGRKLTTADKAAGLTKDTVERSIETGTAYSSSKKKWLSCLVQGESRTITYNGASYDVDGYDTYARNVNTLLVLRKELNKSISDLADFRAKVRTTPKNAKDFTVTPAALVLAQLENFFQSASDSSSPNFLTNNSDAIVAAVPTYDPSRPLTAVQSIVPVSAGLAQTSILAHPEFNADRAAYILALARNEVNTPSLADQDASQAPTDTQEE